ncbi:hypothetical protein AN477_07620 [Alicyclobacillus ferrooxydans]|uniref:Mannose-6-phosphate isomerase n=2 Tax=Alicyclobacillus ferrooxydans TaxID=471514 RepID=A0A0P9EZH5_9BACL|nr:hypothetical protein AN477_07620 [Alicyclobacillus ferrooxydans]
MERVWGGQSLKSTFHDRCQVQLPVDTPVGEYWVLSGHPHGTSVVSNGPLRGLSLVELTEMYPRDYLGNSVQPRFPLLIKFLEAAEDLSVQVHPSDHFAQRMEDDFGKTEAWYILDSKPGGKIVYGHSFPSRAVLRNAFENGTIGNYLNYRDIEPGDTILVPSETLHALLAGTKVIEIQQTSDVTYRVYDWDRVGTDGVPRELHVDKAAEVLFPQADPSHLKTEEAAGPLHQSELDISAGNSEQLIDCPYFTLYKWNLENASKSLLNRESSESPDILIVIRGSGRLMCEGAEPIELSAGDTCLVPTSIGEIEVLQDDASSSPLQLLLVRY